ncbi:MULTISPECIES: SMC-Scp complex subunit ScpB [unclassified Acinetobacter]|uniref:SMC-Scp complex subunit ScpB n=1 Tax=unclassified Acinetobacter TaxID=196816 RepID=UPI0035BA91BF
MNSQDNHHEVLMQIEALVFASEAPISVARIKQALNGNFSSTQIRQLLQQLAILQHGRSVELVETAQGFKFQVRAKYRDFIHQAWPERPIKLSNTLLEILSVIAYQQPVTRGDIEQLRGVTTNSQALRTLFEYGWIKESGFREVPGRPALLVTTPAFLDAFGLQSLADLPVVEDPSQALQAVNDVEKPV